MPSSQRKQATGELLVAGKTVAVANPVNHPTMLVTKSNHLIGASYTLSMREYRVVMLAISKIDPRKGMPTAIKVKASDYARIFGCSLRHAYQDIRTGSDHLMERMLFTHDGRHRDKFRWVDKVSYADGEGHAILWFTIHVYPYLARLNAQLTTFDIRRISNLGSIYSCRLLEMLMQFKSTGLLILPLEVLRERLQLGDTYARFSHLNSRIIAPAVNELNANANMDIRYVTVKTGRAVTGLKFSFSLKHSAVEDEGLPPLLEEDPDEKAANEAAEKPAPEPLPLLAKEPHEGEMLEMDIDWG
jgi:plasmid replication initiation protein